ncbi:MAG: hypothetical protein IOD12_01175 [Silvanigrellales bacterium]|nr:hypothetical protein [Silvanigrellales bacterium]
MHSRLIFSALSLVLVSGGLHACKSRGYNQSGAKGIQVDSPEGTPECNDALDANAPYDAPTLGKALTEAMNVASQKGGWTEENFKDLLFNTEVQKASRGELTVDSFFLDPCYTHASINTSMKKPVVIFSLSAGARISNGGIAIYKGHVFAEGFYRNRNVGVDGSLYPRRKYDAKELLTQQPHFIWQQAEKRFVPALGKASETLAKILIAESKTGTVELHRGTNMKYSDPKVALATLNNFPFGTFGGIFTTPEFEAAKRWSSPVVLSTSFSKDAFLSAVTNSDANFENAPSVYVGVEHDYVEAAFLYKPGSSTNLFFDNVKKKCAVKAKDKNAEATTLEECP